MNDSADYPSTPPIDYKRWVIRGFIAVMVLVIAAVGARPAYRSFKQWRSQRLSETAAHLLEHNETTAAREKAQAALQLAPRNPNALRVMAQVLTRNTNATALQFWAQLMQTGQATETDRHTFVEQALRAGAVEAAGREIQRLLHDGPDRGVNLWLASQWFTLINNRDQALEYASKAALRDPTNRQYKLFISSLQFDSPTEAQRLTARSNVWNRARETDGLAIEALMFLTRRQDLSQGEKEEVIKLLEGHPGRNVTHELMALSLKLQCDPQNREKTLATAVEHFAHAPPEDRVPFAVWLNQNGETKRTLEALPLEESLKRKDFFLPYLDAMASLQRWAELQKLLETQKTPLETAYLEAFRARCNAELNLPDLANLRWKAAHEAAQRNPEQLLWLARYAEKCGEVEFAKSALRSLISCVSNPLPAFKELEQLTQRNASTAEVRAVLKEMVRRWPEEASVQNDWAYYNLLVGDELAASYRAAAKLAAAAPSNLAFRTTLALALYQQKDFAAALGAYRDFDYPWQQAQPNQRAVLAAVLAANGQLAEGQKFLNGLSEKNLRPEEYALVKHLF